MCLPLQSVCDVLTPRTSEHDYVWNRVIAVKWGHTGLAKVRSYWSGVNPWCNAAGVLIKKGNSDTQGEHHVKAEMGVMLPQAKEHKDHQHPPEVGQQAWARAPLTALWRNQPADTLILDFGPPRLWEKRRLLSKPLPLWYFVTVALANKCRLAMIFNLKS